jgi:hypothetical protein
MSDDDLLNTLERRLGGYARQRLGIEKDHEAPCRPSEHRPRQGERDIKCRGAGHLDIKDDKTGETLPLDFVEIHQPVRHLKKEGQYFACTDFRKPGSKDEYYDIDFWVDQKSGKLEVKDVKVPGAGRWRLDPSAALYLRRHGHRGHPLIWQPAVRDGAAGTLES